MRGTPGLEEEVEVAKRACAVLCGLAGQHPAGGESVEVEGAVKGGASTPEAFVQLRDAIRGCMRDEDPEVRRPLPRHIG